MVQVAWGYFCEGHITPTFEYLESEWHEACYPGAIQFQSLPYKCPACKQRIEHRDYVVYVTIGNAPDDPYMRAEGRGYEMAWIEHKRCPKKSLANKKPARGWPK